MSLRFHVLLVSCVILAGCVFAKSNQPATTQPTDHVRTTRLEVVNTQGKLVLLATSNEKGDGELCMYDANEKPRVTITMTRGGAEPPKIPARITLLNEQGRDAVRIAVGINGDGAVGLLDGGPVEMAGSATIAAGSHGGNVFLTNAKTKTVVAVTASPGGRVAVANENGGGRNALEPRP